MLANPVRRLLQVVTQCPLVALSGHRDEHCLDPLSTRSRHCDGILVDVSDLDSNVALKRDLSRHGPLGRAVRAIFNLSQTGLRARFFVSG